MLEKIIMGQYKGPEEIKVEESPINPTEEDLKNLEAELIRVNEQKFGSLVEETPQIKRLNYTKRDDSHTKIQSI
jgi:hypothetical protein